jgi:hypothetical protein
LSVYQNAEKVQPERVAHGWYFDNLDLAVFADVTLLSRL